MEIKTYFLTHFGKRQKRDGSAQKHSGAVLSLAWNRLTEHVLASGGADSSVILWDLEETKPATVATHFDGMVIQSTNILFLFVKFLFLSEMSIFLIYICIKRHLSC